MRYWRDAGNAEAVGEFDSERLEVVRAVSVKGNRCLPLVHDVTLKRFFGWMVLGCAGDRTATGWNLRIRLAKLPRGKVTFCGRSFTNRQIYDRVSWKDSVRLLWLILRSRGDS